MSTRLSLICHAGMPATHAVAFLRDDPADPGQLTEAAGLVSRLGRIDRLWTAPERRAQQTAGKLGPDATVVVSALRDCDYGGWQGRALADIQAASPEDAAAWLSDMGSAPHGGESLLNVLARVGQWLDSHREPGHTVAVTHPAVIRAAIVHALGALAPAFWLIDVEPLSVADLRLNNGRWTLRSLGRTLS